MILESDKWAWSNMVSQVLIKYQQVSLERKLLQSSRNKHQFSIHLHIVGCLLTLLCVSYHEFSSLPPTDTLTEPSCLQVLISWLSDLTHCCSPDWVCTQELMRDYCFRWQRILTQMSHGKEFKNNKDTTCHLLTNKWCLTFKVKMMQSDLNFTQFYLFFEPSAFSVTLLLIWPDTWVWAHHSSFVVWNKLHEIF